jgi:hypothetical protein
MVKEPVRKLDPFTERTTSPIYANYMARWETKDRLFRRVLAYISKKSLSSLRVLGIFL